MQERQFQIIELLMKSSSPLSLDEIAKEIHRSKRTIMRDLSSIKDQLETLDFAELKVSANPTLYALEINNYQAFERFRRDHPNDNMLILYELLVHEYSTLDDLAASVYMSKATIAEKIKQLRNDFGQYIAIESTPRGHFIHETVEKRCFILANLIEYNQVNYLKMIDVSEEQLTQLELVLRANASLLDVFPNMSLSQIQSVFLSALKTVNTSNQHRETQIFKEIYELAGLVYSSASLETLAMISDEVITINLMVNESSVARLLRDISERNSIQINVDSLKKQIYLHLKRVLSYPSYLESKEVFNIESIKGLYPFSFDLSLLFVREFEHLYHYTITNHDLLGLYFTVELVKQSNRENRIALFAPHNALATINSQLIENSIEHVVVRIIDRSEELDAFEPDVIINAYNDAKQGSAPTLFMNYILGENDIKQIREYLENTTILENKALFFPKKYSFELDKPCSSREEVVRTICLELEEQGALDHNELTRILAREQQGNSLVIHNYLIPHCVSTKDNHCMSVYVHLKHPLQLNDVLIQHVLVTTMSSSIRYNMNIFKFLYRYLNTYQKQLESVTTYEGFTAYIGDHK